MDLFTEPGRPLEGEIKVPGDKSISHRAIKCASLASGISTIKGFLESDDCIATLKAFQSLGIGINRDGGTLKVEGKGLYGLTESENPIDLANSGTSLRLAAGILAGQRFNSILTGDESLKKRPMERITTPLNKMGFSVQASQNHTPPLIINSVSKASAIDYELPVASAQVKSCLMFASLFVQGETTLRENLITRDHTERMFKKFKIELDIKQQGSKKIITIIPPKKLEPCDIEVIGDFSSAAFFILAALITPNSHILIKDVGVNNTRTALLTAFKKMGAKIEVKNISDLYEPKGDIEVKYSKLVGIDLNPLLVPNLIDEMPVLFIAAALAEGTTRIRGAEELRFKESDRLKSMSRTLNLFGVKYKLLEDGIDIEGVNQSKASFPFNSAEIDSFGDHRIAMASIIGALRSKDPCKIKNCANISTSFPGFIDLSNKIGITLKRA